MEAVPQAAKPKVASSAAEVNSFVNRTMIFSLNSE
jgi:hypothetical protein